MVEPERASSIVVPYHFTQIALDRIKNEQELHIDNTALGLTGIE